MPGRQIINSKHYISFIFLNTVSSRDYKKSIILDTRDKDIKFKFAFETLSSLFFFLLLRSLWLPIFASAMTSLLIYSFSRLNPLAHVHTHTHTHIYIYTYSKNTYPDASRMVFRDVLFSLLISRCCTSNRLREQPRPGSGISRPPLRQLRVTYVLPAYSNVYTSSALSNGKSSFPLPHLRKEIYALHLLCLITNSQMAILVCSSCLSFYSYLT